MKIYITANQYKYFLSKKKKEEEKRLVFIFEKYIG